MTPEEKQKYGYTVTSPEENEKRQKEVELFLPGFAKLKPLLARISADQEPLVFEGLPHQECFSDEHAAELKTKQTISRHGSAFYQTPLKLKAEDARKLNALIQHTDAYIPYQGIPAHVGFQPDFSLVWDDNGKPIEIQICFKNGGEVKAYHDNTFVFCQLDEIKDELKTLLKNYHQNLPQSAR